MDVLAVVDDFLRRVLGGKPAVVFAIPHVGRISFEHPAVGSGLRKDFPQHIHIQAKRRTTRYLHLAPVLAGDVPELDLHP